MHNKYYIQHGQREKNPNLILMFMYMVTLTAPITVVADNILLQFVFSEKNKAWHFMWIALFFSEKKSNHWSAKQIFVESTFYYYTYY